MTISKAMNKYNNLPRSVIDYVRGAYKRALEKQESTLPFSLLKVAVERACAASTGVVASNTIHVKTQQLAHSSKTVNAVDLPPTEGQAGKKDLPER